MKEASSRRTNTVGSTHTRSLGKSNSGRRHLGEWCFPEAGRGRAKWSLVGTEFRFGRKRKFPEQTAGMLTQPWDYELAKGFRGHVLRSVLPPPRRGCVSQVRVRRCREGKAGGPGARRSPHLVTSLSERPPGRIPIVFPSSKMSSRFCHGNVQKETQLKGLGSTHPAPTCSEQ